MRHKVKWLFVWICLVLWLGNIFGCASTTEQAADAVAPEATPADPQPALATRVETTPSLKGLDRADWPRIPIAPEHASVTHYPTYYSDYALSREEAQINFDEPFEQQVDAAMDGSTDHGLFDDVHALELFAQPVKFGLDTILLPARVVMDPPWNATQTTR